MKNFFHIFLLVLVLSSCVFADTDEASEKEPISTKAGEFTDDQMSEMKKAQEKHEFQAEVSRMMDIIINSLYTQKEVFLRELVSNSADALEKARYVSVSDKAFLGEKEDLDIRVEHDSDSKTITITDTGIGMSKQDLINNLGTVAKSGTTNFLEAMAGGNDVSLIGQFGVGFYSTFLVADRVQVASKKNDDDQWIWESSADASFSVTKDPRGNTLKRGTKVTLHLKEDSTEFLSESKLRELLKKFSQFLNFPIYLKVSKSVEEEVIDEEAEEEEKKKEAEKAAEKEKEKEEKKDEDEAKEDDEEKKDEEKKDEDKEKEERKPKMKKVKKQVDDWEQINTQKALWLRSKEEITEEEYTEFYKGISKDFADPMSYIHFSAEGELEFKSILYIPEKAPHDMFDNYFSKQSQLKLYVRRVLVADKFEDLMPRYLHFVKGVLDSDDLPLNVSREQLHHQQNKIMKVISKKLVRKFLDLLKKIAKDSEEETKKNDEAKDEDDDEDDVKDTPTKYEKFWKEFGRNMKLGCYEDDSNRSKIAKLLRFRSSQIKDKTISLEQYIEQMGEGQDSIYYIAGENEEMLAKSPTLQIFDKKKLNVLYLTDTMDEPCVQRLTDFEGKKFVSVQKGNVKLDDSAEAKSRLKKLKKMYEPLITFLKSTLSKQVQNVEISTKLVNDPCAVVSTQWGYSPYQERIMKTQAFANREDVKQMTGKKIFEINPNHPVIRSLNEKVKADKEDANAKITSEILFSSALMASGYDLNDPAHVAASVYKLISKEAGVDPEAVLEEIDVDSVELDEAEESKEEEPEDDDPNMIRLDPSDIDVKMMPAEGEETPTEEAVEETAEEAVEDKTEEAGDKTEETDSTKEADSDSEEVSEDSKKDEL
eukprot:Platyproteum_vivax@DN2827_c0_g1_i1.p1